MSQTYVFRGSLLEFKAFMRERLEAKKEEIEARKQEREEDRENARARRK